MRACTIAVSLLVALAPIAAEADCDTSAGWPSGKSCTAADNVGLRIDAVDESLQDAVDDGELGALGGVFANGYKHIVNDFTRAIDITTDASPTYHRFDYTDVGSPSSPTLTFATFPAAFPNVRSGLFDAGSSNSTGRVWFEAGTGWGGYSSDTTPWEVYYSVELAVSDVSAGVAFVGLDDASGAPLNTSGALVGAGDVGFRIDSSGNVYAAISGQPGTLEEDTGVDVTDDEVVELAMKLSFGGLTSLLLPEDGSTYDFYVNGSLVYSAVEGTDLSFGGFSGGLRPAVGLVRLSGDYAVEMPRYQAALAFHIP